MQHHPDLPQSLMPPAGMFDLEQIWYEVCEELLNRNLQGRTHGNSRTYDAGCSGPICRKATRDRARRRTTSKPREEYVYLDAILEFFRPIAEELIEDAYKGILLTLTKAS